MEWCKARGGGPGGEGSPRPLSLIMTSSRSLWSVVVSDRITDKSRNYIQHPGRREESSESSSKQSELTAGELRGHAEPSQNGRHRMEVIINISKVERNGCWMDVTVVRL